MTHTFLLEIGLEEMPARVVFPTVKQLKEKVATFLEEERLTYDMIKCTQHQDVSRLRLLI